MYGLENATDMLMEDFNYSPLGTCVCQRDASVASVEWSRSYRSLQGNSGTITISHQVANPGPSIHPICAYRFLPLRSFCFIQRIMILTNMELQKVLCGEVSATIGTPIRVYFGIMNLKLLEGGK